MSINYIDISPLPMLNTDLEIDGKYPQSGTTFRDQILQSDCFLFASPEYNYSVTAPLKNAIDWVSRPPNVWTDKAAAIVSAAAVSVADGRSMCSGRVVLKSIFLMRLSRLRSLMMKGI
ncbi:putative NAD(P)H dehydrogenase (quinone) [Helianthus debilis subsp. tardiflorus]